MRDIKLNINAKEQNKPLQGVHEILIKRMIVERLKHVLIYTCLDSELVAITCTCTFTYM